MQTAVLTATTDPRSEVQPQVDDIALGVPSPFPRSILSLQANQGSTRFPITAPAASSSGVIRSPAVINRVKKALAVDRPSTAKSAASTVRFAEPVQTELQSSLDTLRESCVNAIASLIPDIAPSSTLQVLRADRRRSAPVPSTTIPVLDFVLSSLVDASQQGLAEYVRSRGDDYMPLALKERLISFLTDPSSDFVAKQLVEGLLSLLIKIDKLPAGRTRPTSVLTTPNAEDVHDPLASLGRQVMTVQSRRSSQRTPGTATPVGDPHGLTADDEDHLWWSIDSDLDVILQLCRRRTLRNIRSTPDLQAESGVPMPEMQEMQERRRSSNYFDHFPPEYDVGDYAGPLHQLPEYEYDDDDELEISDDEKHLSRSKTARQRAAKESLSSPSLNASSEKMRMDLESVTSAIDRLYEVAPQLHNQRVELREPKVAEMESARRTAQASASELALQAEGSKLVGRGRIVNQTAQLSKRWSLTSLTGKSRMAADAKGKGKAREQVEELPELSERKQEDLNRMLELIGKSSNEERRIANQRVEIGDFASRLEKVKVRDQQKKEQLAEQILKHSGSGRLSSQDAVLPRYSILSRTSESSTRETDALMSLPEFMNEAPPPASLSRNLDPNALISLPEFFLEQDPRHVSKPFHKTSSRKSSLHLGPSGVSPLSMIRSWTQHPGTSAATANPTVSLVQRLTRARSNSAPSTGWLAKDSSPTLPESMATVKETQNSSALGQSVAVSFVAEYQQNLHAVQICLRLQDSIPGRPVELEVLIGDNEDAALTGSDIFVIRTEFGESPRLSLPAPVLPGLQELKAYGEHFEVKLAVPALAQIPVDLFKDEISSPYENLLDSTHISSLQPTSFICVSCPRPIVTCVNVTRYVDLPSEHWTELMDAWMCHAEQKLTDAIMKTAGGGFWPKDGIVLIGGNYLLVDEANVAEGLVQSSEQGQIQDITLVRSHRIGDRQRHRCLWLIQHVLNRA
ncbi:hypothetical protein FRB95_002096 [Tulasnella sp. JGI-2019a]|nr:hypothetical protein FRB95_002096 [Tulasnella sp. JGI-2019a]